MWIGTTFYIVFYNLGKDCFNADTFKNNLFRKDKITEPFEDFLNILKESVGISQKRNK